jgi:hypothetical protein
METTERDPLEDATAPQVDETDLHDVEPSRWQRLVAPSTLIWHVAALTLLLLALLPIIDNGSVAFPDEGVYSAQARNLADGSWYGPRSAPEIDRTGQFDPNLGVIVDGKSIPYGTHPLYPLVLLPGYLAGGTTGMLVISLAGSVLAALSAALLARRLNPAYAVPALWLAGIGTPLLFDSYLVMGHSLVAACCGWLVLAVTAAVDDRRWWAAAGALALTVPLVALRSEGLIVAASVGGMVGLAALPIPRRRAMDWPAAFLGGAIVVLAGVTYLVNGAIGRALTERGEVGSTAFNEAAKGSGNPLEAAWVSLVQPWGQSISAKPSLVLLVIAVALAAISLRVPAVRPVLPVALFGLAAAAGVVTLFEPPQPLNGLVAATPVLVFGLVFLQRPDLDDQFLVRLVGTATISTSLLLLTIYSSPGAQWGGRFFHVLLPLLVPLTVLGLDRGFTRLSCGERRVAIGCIAVATLTLAALSVRVNVEFRREFQRITEATNQAVDQSRSPTIVAVTMLSGNGLARGFWDSPHRDDVVVLPKPAAMFDLLDGARAAGVDRVLMLSSMPDALFSRWIEPRLDDLGWQVGPVARVEGTGIRLRELRAVSST